MDEMRDNLRSGMRNAAERAIELYAQGILTVEVLMERMMAEWKRVRIGDDQPPYALLVRIAQRICSRELYAAWSSSDADARNRAFGNLRRYLACSLLHSRYGRSLRGYEYLIEDILHQALEALHRECMRAEGVALRDPATFLKWAQTILLRQAHAFLQRCRRDAALSLDAHPELFTEQFVDTCNDDPLKYLLRQEVQKALGAAILSMRNRRYQQVLIYTYIVGVDENEQARRLQARVQDIYLWRHRALKALRSKPELMQGLRSLLE
jgi:DNA-directed RNA polymerase specialized sigma24 family protein